jgi:hypothetical protein
MKKYLPIIIIPFFALSMTLGCVDLLTDAPEEPVRDNPRDIDGTSFTSPQITVNDLTVDEFGGVFASWSGGPSEIASDLEFQYSLNGVTSGWSSDHRSLHDILPNGSYTLEVTARYRTFPNDSRARTTTTENISVSEAPDEISAALYPHATVLNRGESVEIESLVYNTSDLVGVNLVLEYDPEVFEVAENGLSSRNLFESNGIENSFIANSNPDDREIEIVQIARSGVNGFGRVSTLRLQVRSDAEPGTYQISFKPETDLRNSENSSILEQIYGREITVN